MFVAELLKRQSGVINRQQALAERAEQARDHTEDQKPERGNRSRPESSWRHIASQRSPSASEHAEIQRNPTTFADQELITQRHGPIGLFELNRGGVIGPLLCVASV